ncbi:MAG: hypothetical protein JSS66_10430 [Armatimonadetes bacterium]|nr:hypothetical protein [Armatimonadota bacterium]
MLLVGSPIQLERVPTYALTFSSAGDRIAYVTAEPIGAGANPDEAKVTFKVRDLNSNKVVWSQDSVAGKNWGGSGFLVPVIFLEKSGEIACFKVKEGSSSEFVVLNTADGVERPLSWVQDVAIDLASATSSHSADWSVVSFSVDLDKTGEHPHPVSVTIDKKGIWRKYDGVSAVTWRPTGQVMTRGVDNLWSVEGKALPQGTEPVQPDRVRGPLSLIVKEDSVEQPHGTAFVSTIWLQHSSATIRENDRVFKGKATAVVDAAIDCGQAGLVPGKNLVYIESATETKIVPFTVVANDLESGQNPGGGP